MAISAKELAAKLGVSASAVSIALNDKPGISDKTRQNIINAANTYGLRRAKRGRARTHSLNLVIYKKHGNVIGETPFFSALIEGVSLATTKAGCTLQVTHFLEDSNIDEQLETLQQSDCVGIILLATETLSEDIRPFTNLNKPVVILDSSFAQGGVDNIVINNVQGAYLATKYLLDCGHTQIGHIASSVRINNFAERSQGFLSAVAEAPSCTSSEFHVLSTQDGAYSDFSAYLDTNPVLPTACFCDNDIIAISCIRALKEHGYRIPEDISIVGFDDIPATLVTAPRLTTIHVYKEELGQRAVKRLLEKLEGDGAATLNIEVDTSLIIRDSVKVLT